MMSFYVCAEDSNCLILNFTNIFTVSKFLEKPEDVLGRRE